MRQSVETKAAAKEAQRRAGQEVRLPVVQSRAGMRRYHQPREENRGDQVQDLRRRIPNQDDLFDGGDRALVARDLTQLFISPLLLSLVFFFFLPVLPPCADAARSMSAGSAVKQLRNSSVPGTFLSAPLEDTN